MERRKRSRPTDKLIIKKRLPPPTASTLTRNLDQTLRVTPPPPTPVLSRRPTFRHDGCCCRRCQRHGFSCLSPSCFALPCRPTLPGRIGPSTASPRATPGASNNPSPPRARLPRARPRPARTRPPRPRPTPSKRPSTTTTSSRPPPSSTTLPSHPWLPLQITTTFKTKTTRRTTTLLSTPPPPSKTAFALLGVCCIYARRRRPVPPYVLIKSVPAQCPPGLEDAPFIVLWELLRVAIYCDADLPRLHLVFGESWKDQDVFWAALKNYRGFKGKRFPPKSDPRAWRAGIHDSFDGAHQAVLFTATLHPTDATTTGSPIWLELEPLKCEQSSRLFRRFGSDRFLEVRFPSLESWQSDEPDIQATVAQWLAADRHVFINRQWAAFYVRDRAMKVPLGPGPNGRGAKAAFYDRVLFFAEGATTASPSRSVLPVIARTEMLDWLLALKNQDAEPYLKLFHRVSLGIFISPSGYSDSTLTNNRPDPNNPCRGFGPGSDLGPLKRHALVDDRRSHERRCWQDLAELDAQDSRRAWPPDDPQCHPGPLGQCQRHVARRRQGPQQPRLDRDLPQTAKVAVRHVRRSPPHPRSPVLVHRTLPGEPKHTVSTHPRGQGPGPAAHAGHLCPQHDRRVRGRAPTPEAGAAAPRALSQVGRRGRPAGLPAPDEPVGPLPRGAPRELRGHPGLPGRRRLRAHAPQVPPKDHVPEAKEQGRRHQGRAQDQGRQVDVCVHARRLLGRLGARPGPPVLLVQVQRRHRGPFGPGRPRRPRGPLPGPPAERHPKGPSRLQGGAPPPPRRRHLLVQGGPAPGRPALGGRLRRRQGLGLLGPRHCRQLPQPPAPAQARLLALHDQGRDDTGQFATPARRPTVYRCHAGKGVPV